MQIHTFAEADTALNQFKPRPLNVKNSYELTTVRALAAAVGNPQDKLRVVHVAGTSGKTSTCYYVAALLQASGAKVGLTVSPHIMVLSERVQINGIPMDEVSFCRELTEFLNMVAQTDLKPSYFELLMVFAYWQFVRQAVDYAVVEVGLGGLLDGSNIISRADKVCVITDIGLDHQQVLGNTISEIAYQKAGIIQPGNHVCMHSQSIEVMDVVTARLQAQMATLHTVHSEDVYDFLPPFQQRNFALASLAAQYVLEQDGQSTLSATQKQAAAHAYIPGRMETHIVDGKTLILDGAHNPQKLAALVASIRATYPRTSCAALISFTASRDHALADNLKVLAELSPSIIATQFSVSEDYVHQSLDPVQILQVATHQGLTALSEYDLEQAFAHLLARQEQVLLVTGSLYLVSAIKKLRQDIL